MTGVAGEVLSILVCPTCTVSNRGGNEVKDTAWREKRGNKMPAQFQPLLNSDVRSVGEFALQESDCIVAGELMPSGHLTRY